MIFFNSVKLSTASQLLLISILGVFLSGCMGMGSKFDCNVESGGKCAPMHHINQMANYGFFGAFADKPYKIDKLMLAERKENKKIQNIYAAAPMRSNEKIQQIWLGPYEDANGNYHEGSYVYVVVKSSSWVNL